MIDTPWGYRIEAESLPDIITSDDFNAMTAGRYDGDARISPAIKAASAAVREYCGWHVFPLCSCEYSVRAVDKSITVTGCDVLVHLPARGQVNIRSVTIAGTAYTDYTMVANGLLLVFGVHCLRRTDVITVTYTAGLTPAFAAGIMEVAGNRVTHALAQSYGVTSEAAGGVSVTYNSSWTNGGGASALADNDAETLRPYRSQGVF